MSIFVVIILKIRYILKPFNVETLKRADFHLIVTGIGPGDHEVAIPILISIIILRFIVRESVFLYAFKEPPRLESFLHVEKLT
jgi:hypothetical protein